MIPARSGTTAEIAGDLVAVEAWDGDGRALVIDGQTGRLVVAAEQDGFVQVYDADVVAVTPGDGWYVRHLDENDKERWAEPVAVWGMTGRGIAIPMIPLEDHRQDAWPIPPRWNFELYHPDRSYLDARAR